MGKKVFVLAAFLALLIACPKVNVSYAQAVKEDSRGIFTSGQAKVWIEPDRARVYLGIETMDADIGIARNTNAEKIKAVLEALKSLKIEGMLIKAPSYNVSLVKEPSYDTARMGRLPKIIGYKVLQYFTVLLQNKDASALSKGAGQVVDTALNSGVNIIQDIEFFKEDDSADKREAIKLALRNAMDNAKTIAETAGVSIKSYSAISSATAYWIPQYFNPQSQMMRSSEVGDFSGGSAATMLAAGKISVSANASIKCEIE